MKDYAKFIFANFLLLLANTFISAQVGIGTSSPASSAKLEILSTSQGFLPPRMTFAQRNAIASPAQGLIIYCTDCVLNGQVQVYNGISWVLFDGQPSSVKIGTQVWMSENLNVTTYSDGSAIPQVTDPTAWAGLTTGAWCWYNNSSSLYSAYGKLYNWYAVTDARGLCPSGWHIPTDAEWTTLESYLGGQSVAGGKLKTTGTSQWNPPNTSATNSVWFNGMPGGVRDGSSGYSINMGNYAYWWSSTNFSSTQAYERIAFYNNAMTGSGLGSKKDGLSVRCVKD